MSRAREIKQLDQLRASLQREISALEEDGQLQSFGLYKPRYGFPDSSKYEAKLTEIRAKQKELIKSSSAAICSVEWQVGGSKAEGQKMIKNNIKLMLLAFNGECDASIAKVKYNNVQAMERRVEKCFEAINKIMAPTSYEITKPYLKLKLDELHLVHEHHERKNEEREEQRRIKEEMRDEAQAQREIERELRESQRYEDRYEEALKRARLELEAASAERQALLTERLNDLQQRLDEARERAQRVKSMAEQTRAGHVYVISNEGSFGEGVYKIGMTRRLEPMDRVKELGDASVPFSFDVHAMIYTEDAPTLENALHKLFDAHRLNRINNRKEFFRVSLQDIERAAREQAPEVELTYFAEAEEYRKSCAWERDQQEPLKASA